MNKHTVCLWYDGGAEEAARFYTGLFPNSGLGTVRRGSPMSIWRSIHRRTDEALEF